MSRKAEIDTRNAAPGSAAEDGAGPHDQAVAEAAYFKAEKRGFAPGHEIQDWLEAEREVQQSAFSTSL